MFSAMWLLWYLGAFSSTHCDCFAFVLIFLKVKESEKQRKKKKPQNTMCEVQHGFISSENILQGKLLTRTC